MTTSYHEQLGRLVIDHPYSSVAFGVIYAVIIVVIWTLIRTMLGTSESKTSSFGTLVTSPSSSLDNSWGSCMSDPGRDGGPNGGCGSASPFATKKVTNMNGRTYVSGFRPAAYDNMKRAYGRSGFLNTRGSGPEVWGNQTDADYWQNELNNPGGGNAGSHDPSATDAGADDVMDAMGTAQAAAQAAVAAVVSGAIPPQAAGAAASHFAAHAAKRKSGFTVEDHLAQKAMGMH